MAMPLTVGELLNLAMSVAVLVGVVALLVRK